MRTSTVKRRHRLLSWPVPVVILALLIAAAFTLFISAAEPEIPALKEVYKDHFMIGAAINNASGSNSSLTGPRFDLLKYHFNIATIENDMKPANVAPSEGRFTFNNADQMIDILTANGFIVHGHVLFWHNQTNTWMHTRPGGGPLPRAQALANMTNHATTVVQHFSDKYNTDGTMRIISWDVINEAMQDLRSMPAPDAPWQNYLSPQQPWIVAVGRSPETGQLDFIEQAFLAARYADPSIKLFYNDYDEHNLAKTTAVYNMVKDINERYPDVLGRPLIDGVGLQGHFTTREGAYNPVIDIAGVYEAVKLYASLPHVILNVSESDIDIGTNNVLTEYETKLQALLYAQLFDIYKQFSYKINAVTFWGLYDGSSWLGVPGSQYYTGASPLLFDRNLQPKLAFYAVADTERYLSELIGMYDKAATLLPATGKIPFANPGYETRPEVLFTITNATDSYEYNGVQSFTGLNAELAGGEFFEIVGGVSASSIGPGESATVCVVPAAGLPIGVYTDTLTVTGSGELVRTAEISFEVGVIDSPAKLIALLEDADGVPDEIIIQKGEDHDGDLDFIIDNDLTIPEGVTVSVSGGVNLIVADGAELYVRSVLVIAANATAEIETGAAVRLGRLGSFNLPGSGSYKGGGSVINNARRVLTGVNGGTAFSGADAFILTYAKLPTELPGSFKHTFGITVNEMIAGSGGAVGDGYLFAVFEHEDIDGAAVKIYPGFAITNAGDRTTRTAVLADGDYTDLRIAELVYCDGLPYTYDMSEPGADVYAAAVFGPSR